METRAKSAAAPTAATVGRVAQRDRYLIEGKIELQELRDRRLTLCLGALGAFLGSLERGVETVVLRISRGEHAISHEVPLGADPEGALCDLQRLRSVAQVVFRSGR